MKTNAFKLLTILLSFFYLNSISQEIAEKNFFEANRELGGDVFIKKSIINTDGTKVCKTFEVEVPSSGDYYLSAWITGCELKEAKGNKIIAYDLFINEEKQTEKFKPEKKSWQSANYKNSITKEDKTVSLNAGINRISFKCYAPLVPNIDFIKLSKDLSNNQISSTKFDNYIREIKQNILIRKLNPIQHKDTLLDLKNGTILSNPSGNYYHHIGATYKYTAHGTWSLNSGDSLKITTNAANFKHIVEVFSYNYPENYTWVTTSTNGIATLKMQIPYTDMYWIRLRSYWEDEDGLVDLTVNNILYEDAVASGLAGFRHPHTPNTVLNYFHCYITGNSRMWIENNDSPIPGKIIGYNNDYSGSGNFNWGYSPRIKKQFSSEVGGILASAYTSATPTGCYDVYIACQNSNIYNYFANLEADDAIQSAPATGAYNCIAWAGGINTAWIWPLDPGSSWYISGQPLASFDWYFADVSRYSGAISYIRSGATSSNSVIDLWAYNGNYTHASVTKQGNNQPHGYDWESKPGNLMRTFHPRNDLNGSTYGSVVEYYKTAGGLKSGMLLDESVEKGHSVMDHVEFTDEELSIIDESINMLSADLKTEFETKYDAWKVTWQKPEIAMHSNPQMYAKSEEYSSFLSLCKEHGNNL